MTDPVSPAGRRKLDRRRAYRMLFIDGDGNLTLAGEAVLADLKKFCRGDQPTVVVSPVAGVVDTHATMLAEGRREVWLRIMAHLKLDDTDILNLKGTSND